MSNTKVKSFYDETMPGKFGEDYEHTRWFRSAIMRIGYAQTKNAVTTHVLDVVGLRPTRILELGPGAGTWTKLLLQRFPDAAIDLVDISKEMLARVRSAIGEREELRFIESDINIYKPEFKYDYFFSSRVLEYIDDKQKFCARIFSILKKGSRGFLITKMPHYKREKFLRKGKSTLHHGQIAPDELKALLHEAGFVDIHMFPVTMVFPLLHSARLNKLVGILFETKAIGRVGSFFAESYCVTFRKP